MFIGLEDETAEDRLRALRRRLEREREGADRFPDGFIASPDGRTVIVRLTMAAGDTDADAARTLVGLVRAEVDRLKPNYRRDLAVVFNGDVPGLIEEQQAVIEDVSLSSLLVMILVGALIVGYYRSVRALAVVGLGLLPGVAVTFALARLAGMQLPAALTVEADARHLLSETVPVHFRADGWNDHEISRELRGGSIIAGMVRPVQRSGRHGS